MRVGLVALAMSMLLVGCGGESSDRHVGYYYPKPQSQETYVARTQTLPDSTRKRRILFVTEMTNEMMRAPYPPSIAVYAKGDHAQKVIITSLERNRFATMYQMRGLLAMMTARARSTEFFRELAVDDVFTFLDLLKMMGFEKLTLTDGDTFAHQIFIE